MRRATRRFAKRWGRLAVLLATVFAFLSGELQVEVHEAFVQHVACAEHGGQIEDVPRATGAAPQQKSTGTKSIHTAPDSPRDHKACELPPALTAGVALLSQPTALHPIQISFLDPQPPEGVPGRTGPPLLHQAPKLSPPRA